MTPLQAALTRKPGDPWTDEELEVLRDRYFDTPGNELAQLLGRNRRAIYYKARRLGLRKTETLPTHKTCEHCERTYARPEGEKAGDWKKRRFCDRACFDAHTITTAPERFMSRVDQSGDCWIYQGDKTTNGYGTVRVRNQRTAAHRYSYEVHVGPIPDGMLVCHACDNPLCVRPDHLWLGTPADNVHDMHLKGRQAKDVRRYRGEAHARSKLTADAVRAIRAEYVPRKVPQRELARRYGVSQRLVLMVLKREIWRHV